MSIFIKGIEIPKNERYIDVRIFADGRATTATGEHPFYRDVMEVIEIPPHGRLIDADALPKYTGYALSANEVAMAVENAPTIIEAEEVARDG